MPTTYFNIIALSAIAFLACSFSPTPVNALSVDSNGLHARHAHMGHVFAKRAPSRRCKAGTPAAGGTTTSSPVPSPTPKPATTTTRPPPPPATTPPSPPPSNPGNAKAGLAWAVPQGNIPAILANFKTPHVSAAYNWGPFKIPGAEQAGYEDIPMLWGVKDLSDWKRLVVAGYARHALGFNEPDHNQQSYLAPDYAATLWKDNVLWLRNLGYSLISPATTSSDGGMIWMDNFFANCGGVNACVDKIAVHWYGTDPNEFIKYLQKWYNKYHKPIWVTEFACMDFSGRGLACTDVQGFARTVRKFMDETWWVEKYFPFAVTYDMGNVDRVNTLLTGVSPTALGWTYFSN